MYDLRFMIYDLIKTFTIYDFRFTFFDLKDIVFKFEDSRFKDKISNLQDFQIARFARFKRLKNQAIRQSVN
jgi:hypothetical protein